MRRRMINIVGPERFSLTPSREARSPRRGNTTKAGRVWASLAAGMLLLAIMASTCGGKQSAPPAAAPPAAELPATTTAATPEFDPADLLATVDHPLVPLSSIRLTVFEGSERDPETGEEIEARVESRVLQKSELVAGVQVTVVDVKEYEDGELVEHTLDYYAQHPDGSVLYIGERVDDYEDGKIVGHGGEWLAGQAGARPGLFMPAEPTLGQTFEQERAPGVAEDRSTVVAVGLDVTTPAGTFADCIKTEDFAPLDNSTGFKYYCPGVGLVREESSAGGIDLVRYR